MAIEVWTAQMAKHRKAKEFGILFLDTTAKSGNPAFAPSWEIVRKFKRNEITWEEYRIEYLKILRFSWHGNPHAWHWLFSQEKVALACYCTDLSKCECHRYILKEVMFKAAERRNIEIIDRGELI